MYINSLQDISGAVATGMEQGHLVLDESDLSPSFYDLRNGLAGELFQKFVNYGIPLAVVVGEPSVHGARFSELAREHCTHPLVRILPDHDQAMEWLATVGKRA